MIRGEIKIELKREKTFVKSRRLCNFYYSLWIGRNRYFFSMDVGGVLWSITFYWHRSYDSGNSL